MAEYDIARLEEALRQLRQELDEAKRKIGELEDAAAERSADELDDEPEEINTKTRKVHVLDNGEAHRTPDGGARIVPSDKAVAANEDDEVVGSLMDKLVSIPDGEYVPVNIYPLDTYIDDPWNPLVKRRDVKVNLSVDPAAVWEKVEQQVTTIINQLPSTAEDEKVRATPTDGLPQWLYDPEPPEGGLDGKLLTGDGIEIEVVPRQMFDADLQAVTIEQLKLKMRTPVMKWNDGERTKLNAGEYWYLDSVDFDDDGALRFNMKSACLLMEAET